MNYWRMSFRIYRNNKPIEVWEQCKKQGIAAMGYYDADGIPIVGDCSKFSEEMFDAIWRASSINSPSAQSSLKHVAYHMKKGDIIYVKQGTEIVGKGKITRGYKYKPDIVKQDSVSWEHYLKVDWDENFKPFTLDLGANQHIVLKLDSERIHKIHKAEYDTNFVHDNIDEIMSAEEGKKYITEAIFRRRNSKLIKQKKANSDCRCEACGMRYEEVYGEIGKDYIIAHHLEPIGDRDENTKTRLDDIALVCSNCHDMLHRTNPPMSVQDLKIILTDKQVNNT
ncbi:HNH endonuclease [Methanolobus halotolerans]|uniref:HNH domain-containing protein n=1 Tax=Methanolobus halotolerans TaxID=2052935 RepID=A0A4E0PVS6_9EURY|nr:HNH endonuclease [Methanolobus halotolerans]TGC09458.1 hypothetical protein CUN85_06410 [Methanolobus halotolerans]